MQSNRQIVTLRITESIEQARQCRAFKIFGLDNRWEADRGKEVQVYLPGVNHHDECAFNCGELMFEMVNPGLYAGTVEGEFDKTFICRHFLDMD